MHYHSNHVYCTQCHWNDKNYASRHMVVIEQDDPAAPVESLVDDADWTALIEEIEVVDEAKRARFAAKGKILPSADFLRPCPTLKPEVRRWLEEHIQPPLAPADHTDDPWGWAMGNDSYRMRDSTSFHLWFYRRRDAMAFIRAWSRHKKPTSYFNYFSGHRWTLDPVTAKRVLG